MYKRKFPESGLVTRSSKELEADVRAALHQADPNKKLSTIITLIDELYARVSKRVATKKNIFPALAQNFISCLDGLSKLPQTDRCTAGKLLEIDDDDMDLCIKEALAVLNKEKQKQTAKTNKATPQEEVNINKKPEPKPKQEKEPPKPKKEEPKPVSKTTKGESKVANINKKNVNISPTITRDEAKQGIKNILAQSDLGIPELVQFLMSQSTK